ncbi:MAG TPA: cytochrome o ubiquinol oxidase subunit IV [Xanthobacteraceae bacterium]|nr:cytochrome o ubiquinol oxidase subunit IV [Xanthobacteraceae bacterium]
MTGENEVLAEIGENDIAPGVTEAAGYSIREGITTYAIGFALAVLLTVASFATVKTPLIWGPGIAVMLGVLAVAQMGVHLVFFLHMTSDPDNTNNALALAFGVLIVLLVVFGSLWIMGYLHDRVMPTGDMQQRMMQMQR